MRASRIFACVVLAAGWAGCGGKGEGSGSFDTGIPDSTPLDEVTSEQALQACENVRDLAQRELGEDRLIPRVCEAFGAAQGDSPSTCESFRDICLDLVEGGEIMGEMLDLEGLTNFECTGDTSVYEGCAVTVGEYEVCYNERFAALQTLFSELTCARAAEVPADFFESDGFAPPEPASCQAIEEQCPGVLDAGIGQGE